MRVLSRALLVVLLLSLLVGAAGSASASDAPEGAAGSPSHIITFPVNGFNYSPANITIFVGDVVGWSGPFTFHPLVSEDGLWTTVNTGDTFLFTFTQPGVHPFYCQVHGGPGGVGMSGTIRVMAHRLYLPVVVR